MITNPTDIYVLFQKCVFETLQKLFDEKYLYQSTKIDPSSIDNEIEQATFRGDVADQGLVRGKLRSHLREIISSPWTFYSEFTTRSGRAPIINGMILPWNEDNKYAYSK